MPGRRQNQPHRNTAAASRVPGPCVIATGKPGDPRLAADVDDVMVLHGLHRAPPVRQRGAGNRVGDRVHRRPAPKRQPPRSRSPHRTLSRTPSCPGGIETRTAVAAVFDHEAVHRPVFGDLYRFWLLGTQCSCQVLAGCPTAEAVHDAHFVEAQPIDSIFLVEEFRIVDQELLNLVIPVGEDLAAGPALIREIQAVIGVAVGHAVEEPHAVIVETTAGMVVDDIEDHGDAVDVANIHQRAQLTVAAAEHVDARIRRPDRRSAESALVRSA